MFSARAMWLRAGRSVCSTQKETDIPALELSYEKLLEKTLIYAQHKQRSLNTLKTIRQILNQLNKIIDIHDPKAVEIAVLEGKNQQTKQPLSQNTKRKWQMVYEYFCTANDIKGYTHSKIKCDEIIPIIPTKSQIERIISATLDQKYKTVFTILAETGSEGEELHKTNRYMIDLEQRISQ